MSKIIKKMHGRTVPLVLLFGLVMAVLVVGTLFNSRHAKNDQAKADTANTSVTVLNTAPNWSVDAEESPASATGSPTNVGNSTTWVGTAVDDAGDPYYLLICKTSGVPTANNGAAPACNGGGSNQWAVSARTNSGVQASASRTAVAGDAESNAWFAWVCDDNTSGAFCVATYKQGNGNFDKSSPFYVNHRPVFTLFTDNSPTDPGLSVTWTASSVDYDVVATPDGVRLVVCKAQDFANGACGAGGTWCSSADLYGLVSSSPTCAFVIPIPSQDKNYTAFGYVVDRHNFEASGGADGTDSVLTVNNVAPTIAAASISVLDADEVGGLTLTVPSSTTGRFHVRWTVTDNNSCQNASSGDEITGANLNLYRSSITQANCQTGANFNANNCYTGTVTASRWLVTYAQDSGTCTGPSDTTANWTATFSLWYVADPTDGTTASDSPFFADTWLASVSSVDDNGVSSPLTEGTSGNDVVSFLAVSLLTSSINYGSLTPGTQNDPLTVTTTIAATGNVGLDEALSGVAMCTTYPSPACSGSATDTIHVANQKYATSTTPYVTYANGKVLTSTTTPEIEVNGFKSTSTSTQASTSTWWGIRVPSSITKSGSYSGQDTITAIKSEGTEW